MVNVNNVPLGVRHVSLILTAVSVRVDTTRISYSKRILIQLRIPIDSYVGVVMQDRIKGARDAI